MTEHETEREDGYVLTITVETEDGTGPTEEQLEDLTDALTPWYGAVSGDHRGWSATVSFEGHLTPDAVYSHGVPTVLTRAAELGLPTRPITRLEIVREDVLDAELAEPNMPDLISGPEAAAILGVSRQRLHQLAKDHPNFPKPVYSLAVGHLYTRAAIERFAAEWERKPGRPAAAARDADAEAA